MAKVQTQLLVDEIDRDRLRALAVIRNNAVAEVSRRLVVDALPALEAQHKNDLDLLRTAAETLRMSMGQLAQAMLGERLCLDDLFLSDGTPRRRLGDVQKAGMLRRSATLNQRGGSAVEADAEMADAEVIA